MLQPGCSITAALGFDGKDMKRGAPLPGRPLLQLPKRSGVHRFEEFKGTGNSELILDRKVSDKRTFPAIDISRSGTRKEELITDPQVLKKMYVLRRILNPMGTMDAIDFLLDKLRNTKNNSEFFDSMNT